MLAYTRKKFLKGLAVLSAMGLVACASGTLPELSIESVSIYAEPDANQNSAIAVDLVLVYDEELAKMLGKMSAAKYFASSKQLLLDNPTLLDIWHWELVPGQIVQDFTPPQEEGDAYAAYVFANYLTPGDHRVKVAPNGIIKILLLKNDLKNLALYDTHDVKLGKTMSDMSREKEESETEAIINEIKLGPVKNPMQPCKRAAPKGAQKINVRPSIRKPIPIKTRPLNPPSSIVPNPCLRKVKQWRN